jgi:hypothetical protein
MWRKEQERGGRKGREPYLAFVPGPIIKFAISLESPFSLIKPICPIAFKFRSTRIQEDSKSVHLKK